MSSQNLATSASSTPGSSAPSTPTSSRKSHAPRCTVPACGDRAVKIVGDCRYCQSKFCTRHRLPEAHACPNLQSCREASIAKNANKLLGEKCVANKV